MSDIYFNVFTLGLLFIYLHKRLPRLQDEMRIFFLDQKMVHKIDFNEN